MAASTAKLSQEELTDVLRRLPSWALEDGALVRAVEFAGFPQAIAFVNAAADVAERENHHPDIDIRYNRVRLALISHDAGGLTARDSRVAGLLEDLIGSR